MKDETAQDIDLMACVDGFSLVVGNDLDIIFVTENVTNYIGLSQVLYGVLYGTCHEISTLNPPLSSSQLLSQL